MVKQKLRLGTVAFSPKGKWNAETEYKRLNVVHFLASSYYAKKENVGQTPTLDSEYWGLLVEGGDVVNNPDEEDITTEVVNNEHVLKLADKEYRPENYSGKGYKRLRKNIQKINLAVTKITVNSAPTKDGEISVTINNIDTHISLVKDTHNTPALVAQTISDALVSAHTDYNIEVTENIITLTRKHSGEVASSAFDVADTGVTLVIEDSTKSAKRNILTQVMINQPNTIYEIRYDFDLNGANVKIPDGCTLKFEGGSVANGNFNNFKNIPIINIANTIIFKNITSDKFNKYESKIDWFYHVKDDYTIGLRDALNLFRSVKFDNKTYYVTELEYNCNTSQHIYADSHAILVYNGPGVDFEILKSNPYEDKYFLFILLDYMHTKEYEGVTGGGFENIHIKTINDNIIIHGIKSYLQGIYKNLVIERCYTSLLIRNPKLSSFDYYDGLFIDNLCTFPFNRYKHPLTQDELDKYYDVLLTGLGNTLHVNHLMPDGLYVENGLSITLSNIGCHRISINKSIAHLQNVHTEGIDRYGFKISNSDVTLENSYICYNNDEPMVIQSQASLGIDNIVSNGVIIRNCLFASKNSTREGKHIEQHSDAHILIDVTNNVTSPNIILENVSYTNCMSTYPYGVTGGIKIKLITPDNVGASYIANNKEVEKLFNKHAKMYSKYCRLASWKIYNSIREAPGAYQFGLGCLRRYKSLDSRDAGIVYVKYSPCFDVDRLLYFQEFRDITLPAATNDITGISFAVTYREEWNKNIMIDILISYDNISAVKRSINPVEGQLGYYNGESIEGFAIENVNIALNSLQYNIIEWGEVIGMSNNVRFKLSSNTPPTVGKFIKDDECILSNYKHIYYTGKKWVDATGADV